MGSTSIDLTTPLLSQSTAANIGASPNLTTSPTPAGFPPLSALLAAATTLPATATKLKPLVYSPALPPIQPKALERIHSGAFFDLKELLPDNVALVQRLQEVGMLAALSSSQPLTA